ncbi:MAG: cell division protein FtsQ/DivIB [Egibacteraceae bacterium]
MRDRRRAVVSEQLRRRRKTVASIAVLVVLVIAGVLITRSPIFSVTTVQVEGLAASQRQVVREALGIRRGENALTVDLEAATTRVERLPWVAAADVRRLPPAGVIVTVARRRPAVTLRLRDAAWKLDAHGVVMAGGRGKGLPTVFAPDADAPPPGEPVSHAGVRQALGVYRRLSGPQRADITRYDARRPRDVRVLVSSEVARGLGNDRGLWIRIGEPEQVVTKMRVARALMRRLKATGPTVPVAGLDVRVAGNPVAIRR